MQYKKDVIYTYDILTIGIGESKIDELLEDMIYHQDEISIALYASEETVRIRLGCKASNQQVADDKVKTIKEKIELLIRHSIKVKNVCLPECIVYNNFNEFIGYLMPQASGSEIKTSIFDFINTNL